MEKHPNLVKFGKQVRKLRLERGDSQEAFADACGLDRSYMSSIERGIRNASLLTIVQLAKTLKVELSELFPPLKQLANK